MQPTRQIESLLLAIPADLRDVVLELRNLIAAEAPTAAEVIRRRGLVYYRAGQGGPVSAGICQILFGGDHIRLGFVHGVFLPDPRRLLQGEPRYKRFVRIDSYETAPWDDLRDLIRASAHFDPRTLAPR